MKLNKFLICIIVFSINSCSLDEKETIIIENPLISVIKLNSAEANREYKVAKKYIDVNEVYISDSVDSEKLWKKKVEFNYLLNKDKKFTNQFQYYNYKIHQETKGNLAYVEFISINKNDIIKSIKYTLELRKNVWVVVDINYVRVLGTVRESL